MNNAFLVGSKVRLMLFNGARSTPNRVEKMNNYNILIGETATVVKTTPPEEIASDRILVQFDVDVERLGLHCHNEVINSLWIKRSDLLLLT